MASLFLMKSEKFPLTEQGKCAILLLRFVIIIAALL